MITNKDLFYCYDLDLAEFLRYKKSIKPLTIALSISKRKPFTLFARNDYLTQCINEYHNSKQTIKLSNHN